MIITITGNLGSGKSTVAKTLAEKLGLKHYSTGDFWRQIAKERGTDVLGLNKMAEKDRTIDDEMDERQKKIGKKEDNFVIDARLAWHFIPHSVKVFLDVGDEEAARRIFSEKRTEEKFNATFEDTLKKIKERRESERKRYKQLYNVDYYDKKNYDLVVDTTKIPAEKVAEKILEFIKDLNKKK